MDGDMNDEIICLNLTARRLNLFRPGMPEERYLLEPARLHNPQPLQAAARSPKDLLKEFLDLDMKQRGAFLAMALNYGLIWESSRRGLAYWQNVAQSLKDIETGIDGRVQAPARAREPDPAPLPPVPPPIFPPTNGQGQLFGGNL